MDNKKQKIHFIGIGGIGVSALARYFLARGDEVSGSDAAESEIIEDLRRLGVKIYTPNNSLINSKITSPSASAKASVDKQPSPSKGEGEIPDLVIYSAAVIEDDPELARAKKQRIKCQKYAQALGELTKEKFTIAVSGMHGKSTTTAMTGLIMEKAGLDPTVIVGTKVVWNKSHPSLLLQKKRKKSPLTPPLQSRGEDYSNFRMGQSEYLVIEADEYDRSFLNYWPKILVLLNIEEEHLDTYTGGLPDVMKTFGEYIGHLPEDGVLVANEEDENIASLVNPILRQGFGRQAKFKVEKYNSNNERGLKLKIPGRHNIGNANAALSVAKVLGIADKIADKSLNEFNGIWRRMEYKGEFNGAKIYDDYGHHPTEIKATLTGARELLGNDNRLWCVFQPHQYHRTYDLFEQFVGAFADADKTIILPIYSVAGRESEEIKQKVSSEKLVEAISKNDKEVLFMEDFGKTAAYLKGNLQPGDVCIIMGAGDIYKLTKQLF